MWGKFGAVYTIVGKEDYLAVPAPFFGFAGCSKITADRDPVMTGDSWGPTAKQGMF